MVALPGRCRPAEGGSHGDVEVMCLSSEVAVTWRAGHGDLWAGLCSDSGVTPPRPRWAVLEPVWQEDAGQRQVRGCRAHSSPRVGGGAGGSRVTRVPRAPRWRPEVGQDVGLTAGDTAHSHGAGVVPSAICCWTMCLSGGPCLPPGCKEAVGEGYMTGWCSCAPTTWYPQWTLCGQVSTPPPSWAA